MVQSIFDDQDDEQPAKRSSASLLDIHQTTPLAGDVTPWGEPAEAFAPEPVQRTGSEPQTNLYDEPEPRFVASPYSEPSTEETVRRSGLAWSAGVVFVGAVVFMLFLGWGADLIFGTSPWGLVAGIVLGSTIGFIQFFRISSQIFQDGGSASNAPMLLPKDDDDRHGPLN